LNHHPFVSKPHRTFLALFVPVMVSLVAEPLTGLVDTFFVARLGEVPLAALGVATIMLSSVIWVFNFLGIGTQTEVANADGSGDRRRAAGATRLALTLALVLGTALAVGAWFFLGPAARWMGATGAMSTDAVAYLQIRLLGFPATFLMIAAFGALRGLQQMRTPLHIAIAANALNIVLDPILIFGWGPVSGLGVAGAAWATTLSQWLAAVMSLIAIRRRLGLDTVLHWRRARDLLAVGRDLVLRTALLLVFLLIATRSATLAGAEAGAAHQVIRQFWVFTAFLLDAYALSAQSLIGFFIGGKDVARARRVAGVACSWGVGTGVTLALLMLGLQDLVTTWVVPVPAQAAFLSAWFVAALAQPLSALSFVTDGVHWGTGDYRYLRNAMMITTGLGLAALLSLDPHQPGTLGRIWIATAGWLGLRTIFGLVRIWPGLGESPFRDPR
jgi:MATE family multidrug resistance protein